MTSQSETGHAKNVANFRELITIVNSFGAQYQPMAEALKVDALEEQAKRVEDTLNKLKEAETLAKQATASLQAEFKTLNTLTSQLMGLLISSGAKASSIDEAKAIQKRITGSNNKKKKADLPTDGTTEKKASRSTSRQSYDSRLDDFEKLITVLQNVPEYKPNEEVFQPETLKKKVLAMKNAIQENDVRENTRAQMMNDRNALLYEEDNGVVAIALKVKGYIKAVFGGVKSVQYKAVGKIKIAYGAK